MSVFIVKIKNNISSIYDNIDSALDFIYSLKNCKLINSNEKVFIEKYKLNSCILLENYDVDLNYNISTTKKINYEKIICNNNNKDETIKNETINLEEEQLNLEKKQLNLEEEELNSEEEENNKKLKKEFINKQNILGQTKIEIVHELNLLKEKQKKILEDEITFNVDCELYLKFKNLKENNNKFIIPFMFEDKYKTFEYIESIDKLDFKHFQKYYKPTKIKTTYDSLFEDENLEKSETDDSSRDNSSSDNSITETFSNIDNTELFLATNQTVNNNYNKINSTSDSNTSTYNSH